MTTLLWIMFGGAVGTGLRYGVGQGLTRANDFPYGTMTVNLVGCLLIGALATWFSQMADLSETVRLAVLVGFLGGFTTFSSFGLDTLRLLEAGRMGAAVTYVLVSNLVGLLAVWAGAQATKALVG
jgi:CrcB protein